MRLEGVFLQSLDGSPQTLRYVDVVGSDVEKDFDGLTTRPHWNLGLWKIWCDTNGVYVTVVPLGSRTNVLSFRRWRKGIFGVYPMIC